MDEMLMAQFKVRVFEESIPRIFNCLDRLSEEQIWQKFNNNSNSIGNLILHLCGNARQWILSGLYAEEDQRQRKIEFELESKIPKDHLIALLGLLKDDLSHALEGPMPKLSLTYEAQGFNETGISILVHVIEHFSYHTGQIALLTKLIVNENLGFYAGYDLD